LEEIVLPLYFQKTDIVSIYIKGMGAISPQQSWNDESLLIQAFDYRGTALPAVEPEYEQWLDPRQLRRMSRIIKMGITAGFMALREAKVNIPDGIITGTAYGCLEDTGVFLNKMVENREEALNPTPFIQSTHNTIGSQIAMLLQCQGYNQTYAHSAFSFESALLDAVMQLEDSPGQRLLIGAVDEITPASQRLLGRFDVFRRKLASTLNVFKQPRKGTINGEGAAFFVVTGAPDGSASACVEGVKTFYKVNPQGLRDGIEVFVREAGLRPSEIDLVLLGKNGDKVHDSHLDLLGKSIFPRSSVGLFKHLCGEYPTSSAFALWLGTRILSERHVPEVVLFRQVSRPLRNVLIFNSWFETHHSVILLTTCRDTI
jgi:3-oxoacyl-[acyl-carrier-protein] synthase II